MITRLDGSGFSHSGIALGDGRFASARTWCAKDDWDLGGVRDDAFSHFWEKGQSVYRLAVRRDLPREAAAGRVEAIREPDDDGHFALAKIVVVAIALASYDLDDEDGGYVRRLAIEAAQACAAVPGERSFYCAELVAYAYGATFRVGALEPDRDRDPSPGPGYETVLDTVLSRIVQYSADSRARPALARLLTAVEQEMPTFLDDAAMQILGSIVAKLRRREPVPTLRRTVPAKRHVPDGEPLPPALVTPRMLLDADWTADHVERVTGEGAPEPPATTGRTAPVPHR